MGVYLSSPVTDKDSIDEKYNGFVYGASSMQGWRTTQEDAHNCIPDFEDKTKTSFFAVYDGHGGAEVAKYCQRHFPDFVKEMMAENSGFGEDIKAFIQNAFLSFDGTLTDEEVIKELKELAGRDDSLEEDDEDDPVGRTETDLLKEEATMPLDQVLAQYKNTVTENLKMLNKKAFKSPMCASTRIPLKKEEENGEISSISESTISTIDFVETSTLTNGIEDRNNSAQSDNTDILTLDKLRDDKVENNNEKPSSGVESEKELLGDQETSSQPGGSSSKAGGSMCESASSSSKAEPSGSGSSGCGVKKGKAKAGGEMIATDQEIDTSEEEEEEDEEMWEMSDDDDDDDDNEDDQVNNVPMMDVSDEEPGSDSGCTACVCMLQGTKLIVANAGDSRCVLSRGGRAVDLSFDHKPEDDSEKIRIEKAGGKVTSDGRVNGGLNLSRAIGDHVYKQNQELPDREQMITALPDVEIAELCEEDQFFVIACDGIWNYMSSQEVVDFVLEKLSDPEKRQKPSLICEELFDHCLAPNTIGDGTGCDNMTCIVVVLDSFKPTEEALQEGTSVASKMEQGHANTLLGDSISAAKGDQSSMGTLKRCSDNLDSSEGKRTKLGGEEMV